MFRLQLVLRTTREVRSFLRPSLRTGQRCCYAKIPKSKVSSSPRSSNNSSSNINGKNKFSPQQRNPPEATYSSPPHLDPTLTGKAGTKDQRHHHGSDNQYKSANSPHNQRPEQEPEPEGQSEGEQKESLAKLIQERKIPFFGLAIVALWMSFYIGKLGVGIYNSSNADVKRMTAQEFDLSLDFPEWFMGITTLRSKLARRARGQVLEIAVGTGRNMIYFRWHDPDDDDANKAPDYTASLVIPNEVMHYTGIDINDDMLAIAIKRARGIVGKLMADESHFRLVHGDVQEPLPRPPDGKSTKYDTVIQSFGLCSVEDPVELIKNLATMVKPNFGRILLLEHGRGSWGFVNKILDSAAEKHFEKHACWWNRDIEQIVRTAAEQVPGLEIRKLERPNWLQAGTVLLIELRVKHVVQPDGTGKPQEVPKPKKSSWLGLRGKDADEDE